MATLNENQETMQGLICDCDLFSFVHIKEDMSKQIFFCFNAASTTLHGRSAYVLLLPVALICHKSIVVQHSVLLYSLQWHVAQQHTHNALLCFHCNTGYTKAPQCYLICTCLSCFSWLHCIFRGTRWRSWLWHCATSRKVAGSIPGVVIGIFHWHNPFGRTLALGLTQPLNRNEYQEYFLRG
jgi:hypothetical protein